MGEETISDAKLQVMISNIEGKEFHSRQLKVEGPGGHICIVVEDKITTACTWGKELYASKGWFRIMKSDSIRIEDGVRATVQRDGATLVELPCVPSDTGAALDLYHAIGEVTY